MSTSFHRNVFWQAVSSTNGSLLPKMMDTPAPGVALPPGNARARFEFSVDGVAWYTTFEAADETTAPRQVRMVITLGDQSASIPLGVAVDAQTICLSPEGQRALDITQL